MAGKAAAVKDFLKKYKKMIIFAIIVILLVVLSIVEFCLGFDSSPPFSQSSPPQACMAQMNGESNPPLYDPSKLWCIDTMKRPSSFSGSSADCHKINESNFLSRAANFLIKPITSQVSTVSQEIFIGIVTNSTFQTIVKTVLLLYIIIWGIYIALGLTQTTLKDFISRLFKIGIVLTLISKQSFNFFNQYLFALFVDGTQELIGMVTNPYCNSSESQVNYFAFTNYAMDSLFGQPYLLLRISSTIMAFPIGWLAFIIFCYTIVLYFIAILRAILAYLIAYTAVGLVLSLGPIFIVTLLFESTKNLFLGWLGMLISFAMEPVILFATIVLVTMFVDQALYDVMKEVTWSPFLQFWVNLNAPGDCDWKCVEIRDLYWYLPSFYNSSSIGGGGAGASGVVGAVLDISKYITYIQSYIVLFIGVGLLDKVGDFATSLSSYLFGGAGMLGAANKAIAQVKDNAKSVVGMDKKSQARRQEAKANSKQHHQKQSDKKDGSDCEIYINVLMF